MDVRNGALLPPELIKIVDYYETLIGRPITLRAHVRDPFPNDPDKPRS